jgi:signal transduction histidine kinase
MTIDRPELPIKLLIIEDALTDQLGIVEVIKQADLHCDCEKVSSIKEGLLYIQNTRFDLVISDYHLHDGVALELLTALGDTPIIVLSGLQDESSAIQAIGAGVSEYLIKDRVYPIILPVTIQSVLRRKKIEQEKHDHQLSTDILRHSMATLNSTLELDEVLHRILDMAHQIIPHDSSSIMLIENRVAQVVLSSGWQDNSIPAILSARFPIDNIAHFREMYTTRAFCYVPDIAQSDSWVDVSGMDKPRSYLAAPICYHDEVIGFLNLDSYTVNHFTPTHIERLRVFIDYAAIALHNAQLFHKAKTLAAMEARQRLARDLHDSVTQTLFAVTVTTQAILKQWKHDAYSVGESLEELQDLTQGALAEIRTLLLELRPSALLEADLGDLLRQLCTTIKGRSRLRVTFHSRGKADTTPDVHVAFFRIAQESLNNIIKHSRAKSADVRLIRQMGQVELVIVDDGMGFDIHSAKPNHMGIKIMQERAQDANIALTITSVPKSGTTIRAFWINKE